MIVIYIFQLRLLLLSFPLLAVFCLDAFLSFGSCFQFFFFLFSLLMAPKKGALIRNETFLSFSFWRTLSCKLVKDTFKKGPPSPLYLCLKPQAREIGLDHQDFCVCGLLLTCLFKIGSRDTQFSASWVSLGRPLSAASWLGLGGPLACPWGLTFFTQESQARFPNDWQTGLVTVLVCFPFL